MARGRLKQVVLEGGQGLAPGEATELNLQAPLLIEVSLLMQIDVAGLYVVVHEAMLVHCP